MLVLCSLARREQVPTQPDIQRQLAADLPIVLREQRLVLIAQPGHHVQAVVAGVVHRAQQETRERVAAVGAPRGGGQRRLVRS